VRVGIDSYTYHRLLGELRPGEEDPGERLPDGGPAVVAEARALGVQAVSLETCYLDSPSLLDVAALREGADGLELVLSWGAPNGLEFGRSAAALDELLEWISLAPRLGCRLMRVVAAGPRLRGWKMDRKKMDELVERNLRRAALWDEVKDRLDRSGAALSGGQQQRLCIARALATDPSVLLMDEPASALDPIATYKIEELVRELASEVTIVIVTHNMQQASRVSQRTAFMLAADDGVGRLVEYGRTDDIFTNPRDSRTEAYITGRFG